MVSNTLLLCLGKAQGIADGTELNYGAPTEPETNKKGDKRAISDFL